MKIKDIANRISTLEPDHDLDSCSTVEGKLSRSSGEKKSSGEYHFCSY